MFTKGKRQQGIPFLINQKESLPLERVPLNEKLFRENWIQELVATHPQILPIDSIETVFSPLISLGREISTNVGYIDNLFISPDGYLTIVEAKLWRNPEAKREVVGQIIDYAKELTKWSYIQLDEAVRRNSDGKGIIDFIKEFEFIDEYQEQLLIDNIEKNLKRGRFLLLIVGDGIRESVEDMVDYLASSSQLQFTLGLIELQVYKNPKDAEDIIIIPNLLTRTKEITRAIIKIENNSPNNSVTVHTDFSDKDVNKKSITEEEFFEQLTENTDKETVLFTKQILEDAVSRGYLIEWALGSFVVKYLEPNGSGQKITLYVVDRKGKIYLMQNNERLKRLGLPESLAIRYVENTAKLIPDVQPHPKYLDRWNKYPTTLSLKNTYAEFWKEVELFIDEINKYSNALL